MSPQIQEIKIKVIQIKDLNFPLRLLNFVLCQFRLFLKRKPYIVQGKVDSVWNRLGSALTFSRDIKSNFFLAPEYTLPFAKTKHLARFMKNEAPKNSVYCVPVEHLTLEKLQKLADLLSIAPETLNLYFPSKLVSLNQYAKLIFNVAIIAIKDNQGNLTFHLQPKIFPARLEESRNIQPHLFQGGQTINVFKAPRLSFAVMICFDLIGWGKRLPDTIIQWLTEPGNQLDILFVLQVNPKPLHREYERCLYLFANHPACRHTSLFFVNCDSKSQLQNFEGEKIGRFNKTAMLGKFKLEYSSEYKVETSIEIPPDNISGHEILNLDQMQRLILLDKGERIVWLRSNTLKDTLKGPMYPRENDIRLYTYKKGSLNLVDFRTTFEYAPVKGPLPEAPAGIYPPITIRQPLIFRGRSQEVFRVSKFLKGKTRFLLIYGEPGIGKSALAQFAAYSALKENPQEFSAGLWFSSKDRHLSLKHFISDLAVSLDYVYLKQLDETEQKSEIIRILRDTLKKASIIIVDNIETIKDPNMMAFIEKLSNYAKVILTSRNPATIKGCLNYKLGPMKYNDIKLLVEYYWPGIDKSLLHRLSKLLAGSPFAVHLLFGYLRTEESATVNQTIEDIKLSGKNVIDWILQKSWDSFGLQEQTVINSLQLFADTFTEEALKGIIGLHRVRVGELFEELKKRYFIETVEYTDPHYRRYQIHPLVRKFSEAKKPKVAKKDLYINYYKEFIKEHCKAENFKHIEQEIRNVERAIELCVERNRFVDYLKILSQLYYYYYERGFWNDAIEKCIKGYEYAQELRNSRYCIEMSSRISWCAFRKEDFRQAKAWLNISKRESKKSSRVFSQLGGLIKETEARIYLMDGKINFNKARGLIESAIETYKSFSNPKAITLQARALTYLGELYIEQQDYEKAIEMFIEVKELAEKYRDEKFAKKILAWTLGNLGEALLLKSERDPKREEYLEICINLFKDGLNLAGQIERQHTVAHCCWGLGVALLTLGRTEGRNYLSSAKDIYQRLGKKSKLSSIDALFLMIAKSETYPGI